MSQPISRNQNYTGRSGALTNLERELAAIYPKLLDRLLHATNTLAMDLAEKEILRLRTVLAYQALQVQSHGQTFVRQRTNTLTKRQTDLGVSMIVNFSVNDMVRQTAKAAGEEVGYELGLIGKTYNAAIDDKWRKIGRINQQVADRAISDMLIAYDAHHNSVTRGASANYRQGERYTGGRLRAALASPLQATATIDGVTFFNPTLVDQQARQWARLNFGAGPKAGAGKTHLLSKSNVGAEFTVSDISSEFLSAALGDSVPSFDVRMPYGPRGAFYIPTGIWLESSGGPVRPSTGRMGQDAYYLRNPNDPYATSKAGYSLQMKRKLTEGVAAWGFIEAGATSLATHLPAANFAFMREILAETQKDVETGVAGKVLAVDLKTANRMAQVTESSVSNYLNITNKNVAINRARFIESLGLG